GESGDRAAGSGAGAGLVQAGYGQFVRHELRQAPVAMVSAAAPHGRIHAFDVQWAFEEFAKNFVRSEIGRDASEPFEDRRGNFFLDDVPMLGTLLERKIGRASCRE